jgi:energy-converting hydrogenase Eha subunit E
MKLTTVAVLYTLMFVIVIAASAPVVASGTRDAEAIVHQNDLAGWQVDGTASFDDKTGSHPVWTVANGEVFCAGHGFGFLRYDKQLADFIVSLEFKAGSNTNSGIGLRGIKYLEENLNTRPSIAGFEVQILDDAGKPSTVDTSGALYRYVAPKMNAVRRAGEWNRLVITCRGPKIVVRINGETVQDFDQTSISATANKPLSGYLSLQNHGGPIVFRNIRLQELH